MVLPVTGRYRTSDGGWGASGLLVTMVSAGQDTARPTLDTCSYQQYVDYWMKKYFELLVWIFFGGPNVGIKTLVE